MDIDFTDFDPKKTQIEFTKKANEQIKLILDNDYTLSSRLMRIQIGGKECDGFRYEVGFDSEKENDHLFELDLVNVLMQPFTAYFCQNITVDYLTDGKNDIDGFIIRNHEQKNYEGKFFKDK